VIALQPIVNLWSGSIVAAEALARFPTVPDLAPAEVFAQAHRAGTGTALETACVKAALRRRREMPPGVLLCVNLSPDALTDSAVQRILPENLHGVVLELTEQAATEPESTQRLLLELRARGALLAIDDASTGYAGLLRLARLRPDIVKLDHALVAGARDRVEQSAVIEALVSLSRRIGARVLGEGVETLDDLNHLAALDVDYAQGWVIAPPAPTLPAVSETAVAACRAARASLLATVTSRSPLAPAEDISSITAALTGSARHDDLHAAMRAAASSLGVDEVALSTLREGNHLREVGSTSAVRDQTDYRLEDFPATRHALTSGSVIEAHVGDDRSDPAERALLSQHGYASLLLTPVVIGNTPLGVLEFRHRTLRQWTTRDIANVRTLADHLAHALSRLAGS
jgi:EAL domain-containing protein (putative c-di-GMP-specific phosphodiesterase class I)